MKKEVKASKVRCDLNDEEGFSMEKKDTTFAVIGCGQFGGSVVEELARQGADVIAIDINEEVIKKYVNIATQAIILDSTDESAPIFKVSFLW